jgi:hypothetical protein
MTVRDQRFAFEDLGPGERILGQPTRRVRIQSGSTTEMRVFGRTERTTESTVAEHWIAPRPAGVDAAALRGWSRGFTGGVRRTNAALGEQMAEYDRRFGDGLALRTVVAMQLTDGKGRVTHDTVRSEVVEMSRGPLDAALFTVPAGYQTVDMRQVAAAADSAQQARRAAGDTASLADDLRKTAGESVRDNAEESVRGAVGGMFRKRRP